MAQLGIHCYDRSRWRGRRSIGREEAFARSMAIALAQLKPMPLDASPSLHISNLQRQV